MSMKYIGVYETSYQSGRRDGEGRTRKLIKTIKFKSRAFDIDFHPRNGDYKDIKEFLTKFLEGESCKLLLHDETSIKFSASAEDVIVVVDWVSRSGSIAYLTPRINWIDAFTKLQTYEFS